MQYLVLIHGNADHAPIEPEWDRFFAMASNSGCFKGGSEIGKRELMGNKTISHSLTISGYMRFDVKSNAELKKLLSHHPVYLNGGSLEICELPKTGG